MKKKLRALFYKFFDYDIVRSVYDTDGNGVYRIKHIRRYKLRKRK